MLGHRLAPPFVPDRQRWGRCLVHWFLLLSSAAVVAKPLGVAASAFPLPFHIRQPRALVLEPFEIQLGMGQSAGQAEVNLLQQSGFAVTVLRDLHVTVPLMRHLSSYSVVYIETHVGPLPNNDAAVATADTRHHEFAAYFANYSLARMRIEVGQTGSYQLYDAVTGRFIHRYDGAFLPHTIFILGSCNALDMPLFWHYLHESGVSTLISWHDHVAAADADRASQYVLTALADGKTVGQAVLAAQASGVGVSFVANKVGWLSFSGDGTDTLAKARLAAVLGFR